jgi:hypothetical protein
MNEQQFLLIGERKERYKVVGYDGLRIEDKQRVFIWLGRPSYYPPNDPMINQWTNIALFKGKPCWVEPIGEAVPVNCLPELSLEETQFLFSSVHKTVTRLHEADCFHGTLSMENIFLKTDGSPLIIGLGRRIGTQEEDLQQLHTMAIKQRALTRNQNLSDLAQTQLPNTLLEKIASTLKGKEIETISTSSKGKEINLEILNYPQDRELSPFDEEEHTQGQGLLDIPAYNATDMTGVLHLQNNQDQATHIYQELVDWIQDAAFISDTNRPYSSTQLHLLLQGESALSPPATILNSEHTETKWEHTESKQDTTKTHSRTLHKRNKKESIKKLSLLMLITLLSGFLLGRL